MVAVKEKGRSVIPTISRPWSGMILPAVILNRVSLDAARQGGSVARARWFGIYQCWASVVDREQATYTSSPKVESDSSFVN